MEYIESEETLFNALKGLKTKIKKGNLEEHCPDEEKTKQFLIKPFLKKLGWVPKPKEMEPEFSAGEYYGEGGKKVDYAIFRDQPPFKHPNPWLIIEAKKAGEKIPPKATKQLLGFAQRTSAAYACWTNGINWVWYKKEKEEGKDVHGLKEFLSHDVTNPQRNEMRGLLAMSRKRLGGEIDADKIEQIVNEGVILRLFENWLEVAKTSPSSEFLKLVWTEQKKKQEEENKLVAIKGNVTQNYLSMLKSAWLRMNKDTRRNPCSKSEPETKQGEKKQKPSSQKELLLHAMHKNEFQTIDELIKKVFEEKGITIPEASARSCISQLKKEGKIETDRKKGARLL